MPKVPPVDGSNNSTHYGKTDAMVIETLAQRNASQGRELRNYSFAQ